MTALVESFPVRHVPLSTIAFSAIAAACPHAPLGTLESTLLDSLAAGAFPGDCGLPAAVRDALLAPAPGDVPLASLARHLHLSPVEILTIAIALAVEHDSVVGRVLAHLQAPLGGARPSVALLTRAFGDAFPQERLPWSLATGIAARNGLIVLSNETLPFPERAVSLPAPLCYGLSGSDGVVPGAIIELDGESRVPLTSQMRSDAARHAAAIHTGIDRSLVLRTSSPVEGRTVAVFIAESLGARPVFLNAEVTPGIGAWLFLRKLIPVFCLDPGPGERTRVPPLPGYDGPVLVVCGVDGFVETTHGSPATWALPLPPEDDRRLLWVAALSREARCPPNDETSGLAERLARDLRHGPARIAQIGRLACHHAALESRSTPDLVDITAAAWTLEGDGLGALAEPVRTVVPDEALVTTDVLQAQLERLVLRCRWRENLAADLGVSARTRYRPGLRVLFMGASGTGKTLAAAWLATRLRIPLYRIDLAAVTSKYIGETEKHLAQVLGRAEHADVMLLFDEADSLFGKRTEVRDSNDRFANAQTNYLLQRMESYDGIVVLTSNNQERFDEAFSRRLDFVIDFPSPGPEERRALWRAHLGDDTTLAPLDYNLLALALDLNGGHIRNAVLAAATSARAAGRRIAFPDVLGGVDAECRKLGRQTPSELQRHAQGRFT